MLQNDAGEKYTYQIPAVHDTMAAPLATTGCQWQSMMNGGKVTTGSDQGEDISPN